MPCLIDQARLTQLIEQFNCVIITDSKLSNTGPPSVSQRIDGSLHVEHYHVTSIPAFQRFEFWVLNLTNVLVYYLLLIAPLYLEKKPIQIQHIITAS